MAFRFSRNASRVQAISIHARLTLAFFFLMAATHHSAAQQRETLLLKDGMVIGPGVLDSVPYVIPPPARVGGGSEAKAKIIDVMDDDLRRTYTNIYHRQQAPILANQPQVKIELSNKTNLPSKAPTIFDFPGPVVSCTAWDDKGLRICFIRQPDKVSPVVQGITEVTPSYVRVQGVKSEKGECFWDLRLPLSSFDSEELTKILVHNANPTKPNDFIEIVNLFEAAKRYDYARKNLEKAILRFNPALDSFKPVLSRFDQNIADQLFAASETAIEAGQFEHAKTLLESVKKAKLSIETQLKVAGKLESLNTGDKEKVELLAWIADDVAKVTDPATKAELQSVLPEIKTYLRSDTAARFADYRRRRSDPTLKQDQLAALAIGGWIYGATAGKDNAAVVAAGIKARRLITDYLSKPTREDQILQELNKLEAGAPDLVAKILANMAPPLPTPDSLAVTFQSESAQGNPTQPTSTIPGRYTIELPMGGAMFGRTARYTVQLPPEYNPFRRYPCILTLPGDLTNTNWQIDWWAGQYSPESKRCVGEATKRGYIVVSPDWAEPKQPSYNFTENEHSLILTPLRDAMRRFSIDTDRVYLSGHFMGADAAWDIALAHPDIWAGCVVVSGEAQKYVVQYWENAMYVPTYFVSAEYDAFNEKSNGKEWDKMLSRQQFDSMVTLYRGRKPDHFQEELPRIMEWMSLPARVRNFAPKKFQATTSRAGDKFFWWFEAKELSPEKLQHPLLYQAGSEYSIESAINRDGTDGSIVSLPRAPSTEFTIWLSPELVDFEKQYITISARGASKRREQKPEPRVMTRTILEDVRGRADRQHPFWMRVDFSRTSN